MLNKARLLLVTAFALVGVMSAVAQTSVNIRLATLAPDNSPWTSALRSMGTSWEKSTERRVRLTVYAGTIPSESSAIARMAVDGLQAATLMVAGLGEIDEGFNVFGIPFFFESDAELAYVEQKLTPLMQERLRSKHYHLVNWGNAGWIRLFSKKPIRTLEDVKQAKLYTTEGNPKMVQWYTANGFHAVPLSAGEIPKQLTLPTGAINAAPLPPVYAVALQIFKDAPHMLDVRLAPLVGATVMTDTAWDKISPDDRTRVLAAAAVMEREIDTQAPDLDARSVAAMKTAGLQIVTLDPKAALEFRSAAENLAVTQRGGMIPPEVFDVALRERTAFRKMTPAK
ncbi:MAG TPA: TRAP transporter substrate-binding protein DctP [Vicinamibacterales bacterium]|nr:TRAP transporter substrate-binding protein DctP [Vicinamibacterales bacterium]